MANNKWARRVGSVFITRPRIASKNTVWLDRKDAERRFEEDFQRPGGHVCLDGPTGVGKTSLVFSRLVQSQVRHIAVMATVSMTWVEFCRRLVGAPTNEELTLTGEIEVGIDKGLPVGKLRISLGEKGRPIDDVTLADKLATTWTEHDVAARLAEQDAVLVLDDLERASDGLLQRFADLAKLMTQAYVSDNAKIVFVGSGDIYKRIHRQNPALDERMSQVSLGAFKRQSDSKIFMTKGFERLKLRHPWNSSLPREFDQRDHCTEAVWEAADGLPKSLNKLGYEIALQAEHRPGVSAHDVLEAAQRMTVEHWIQYGNEFQELITYLEGSPIGVALVRTLYEEGIGRIHRIPDVMRRVALTGVSVTEDEFEEVMDTLIEFNFLVRTGKANELVFSQHPTAAHTLGVYMRDPARFRTLPSAKRPSAGVQLAFPLPADRGPADGESPSEDA